MYRPRPIRGAERLPRGLMHGANLAFWLLIGVSVVVGGAPVLAHAIVPSGADAAQTSDARAGAGVRLRVALGDLPGGLLPPRVLTAALERPTRARAAASPGMSPKVAIVIDDLGPDIPHSRIAIGLARAVTLSILPYADAAPALAAEAQRHGHEVLVHEPMQALSGAYAGPLALRIDLPPDEIRNRLRASLSRVPGAIGINNHMGSAFTQDEEVLVPVAEELASRHLLFFDSRTTPDTRVVEVAHASGVASAERDVFLDDVPTAVGVRSQLAELEARARRQGVAIAIGHPHEVTLAAVAAWCKQAQARGYTLIPISEAIRLKTDYAARFSLAEAK